MRVNVFLNLEGNRQLAGSLAEKDGIIFQYFPSFIQSDLQLSPLALPLSRTPWKSTREIFGGLPGFIADSLPDSWGNLLLDRQLRKKRTAAVSNFSVATFVLGGRSRDGSFRI